MSHYTDQNQISEQAWLNSVLGQMGLQKSSNKNHDGINEVGEIPPAPATNTLNMLHQKLQNVQTTLNNLGKSMDPKGQAMQQVYQIQKELDDVRMGMAAMPEFHS
jgi:hypothetical protein